MAIKLFVTDLDGTLLPAGNQVSAGNIKAAHEAVAAGVVVAIATGRMFRAARPVAQSIGMDLPIISYNGAFVCSSGGEVLHREFIPDALALEVMEFFKAQGWYLQIYSEDRLYFAEETEEAKFYQRSQCISGEEVGWHRLRDYCREVPKLLTVTSGQEESRARMAALNEKFQGRLVAVQSNPRYVELVLPGVSKAAAIELLAERLEIDMDDVMAIGDAENDLLMLRAVGRSIAMGNAIPAVKALCDYETGNCEEDGWAEAVYRYVLGREV